MEEKERDTGKKKKTSEHPIGYIKRQRKKKSREGCGGWAEANMLV